MCDLKIELFLSVFFTQTINDRIAINWNYFIKRKTRQSTSTKTSWTGHRTKLELEKFQRFLE